MEKSILSEELNAMKYLLGYKRGVVISEQQTTAPVTGTTVTAAPVTGTTVTAAPVTGTTVTAAPVTGTPASATNLNVPDLIKQVQQILKDKYKAVLGSSGPNKDGVDGILGKRTIAAIETAIKTLPAVSAPTTGTPPAAAPTTQFKTQSFPELKLNTTIPTTLS